jgi:hypothetical protein
VVLIVGAAPMLLQSRGALKDIDNVEAVTVRTMPLPRCRSLVITASSAQPHVKWVVSVQRVAQIVPTLRTCVRCALCVNAARA